MTNTRAPLRLIYIENDGGALDGYVVDATEPNLENYLSEHTNLNKAIMLHLRQRGDRVALLRNIRVAEDSRGQGYGGQLLEQFCQEAEAAGATAYLLICDALEEQAGEFDLCAWYEAFGFCRVFETSQGPLMVLPEALCESLGEFLGVEPGVDRDDDAGFEI